VLLPCCCSADLQVCNLAWSSTVNELVSSHGYTENHLSVWDYPSMKQVCILPAAVLLLGMMDLPADSAADGSHVPCPLHGSDCALLPLPALPPSLPCFCPWTATSPDGESIATGAPDGTLRFWRIFPQRHSKPRPSFGMTTMLYRDTEEETGRMRFGGAFINVR